jgi:hypothetical protein
MCTEQHRFHDLAGSRITPLKVGMTFPKYSGGGVQYGMALASPPTCLKTNVQAAPESKGYTFANAPSFIENIPNLILIPPDLHPISVHV